jgi:hypothetical protein
LDRSIEIEQQLALAVFAHHALDPEEGREANAAGDRLDAMQAGAGVENEVAGGQLHPMRTVGVGDHELASVIFVGRAEEQGD